MNAPCVLIVDDSCLYQRSLMKRFNRQPGCKVVGVASNADQALMSLSELMPDLNAPDTPVTQDVCETTSSQLPPNQLSGCIVARVRPMNSAPVTVTARSELLGEAAHVRACVRESFGGMKS